MFFCSTVHSLSCLVELFFLFLWVCCRVWIILHIWVDSSWEFFLGLSSFLPCTSERMCHGLVYVFCLIIAIKSKTFIFSYFTIHILCLCVCVCVSHSNKKKDLKRDNSEMFFLLFDRFDKKKRALQVGIVLPFIIILTVGLIAVIYFVRLQRNKRICHF